MQFHNFIFFKISNEFYTFSGKDRKDALSALIKCREEHTSVKVFSYLMTGLKNDTDFMLWIQSEDIREAQKFLIAVRKSELGKFVSFTHTYLGAQRHSIYTNKQTVQEQAIDQESKLPFFILYPFTKTKEWHFLSAATRKSLMNEHIRIGHNYTQIRQNLLYSYGLDDQEFLVSYETEKLEDFQSLVMELRSDEVRRYTQSDVPIYTCSYMPLEQLKEIL